MPSSPALRASRDGFPHVTRRVQPSACVDRAAEDLSRCPCDREEALDLPLARLHGRSVAILLKLPAHRRVLRGRGEFLHDPDLGGVLRIRTHSGRQVTEFLLVENAWEGTIRSGRAVGCDFLVCLQPVLASSATSEAT